MIRNPIPAARLARRCGVFLMLLGCNSPAPSAGGNHIGGPVFGTVTLDTLQRFQTMTGWEAVAQAGQGLPGYPGWANRLFDLAANDLGLNRLRVGIRAGSENTVDYFTPTNPAGSGTHRCSRYVPVNDNDNPLVINPAGFQFGELDHTIENVVLPMRARLAARGERLFVNLNYIAFINQCDGPVVYPHQDPAEYAEYLLAAFLHLQAKYGFTPDAVEVILEPDNTPIWRGGLIGQAIVAAGSRLAAGGFQPVFIAPSTTDMGRAVQYFDEMIQVPGVRTYLGELSYHRYEGVSDANLRALAARGSQYGVRTAMLEHIGSGVEDLYRDLTIGQASAWQQFGLAHLGGTDDPDDGGLYYMLSTGQPVPGVRTPYLRQYFHYVRMGAQRVGAESDSPALLPVGFRNPNGGLVVVLQVERTGELAVRGLRPGTYGASLTSETSAGAELGNRVAGGDGILRVNVPAKGVLAIYSK